MRSKLRLRCHRDALTTASLASSCMQIAGPNRHSLAQPTRKSGLTFASVCVQAVASGSTQHDLSGDCDESTQVPIATH